MPTPTRQITGTFKDSHLQPAAGKIVKFTAQTYRTDTVNKIRIDLNAVEVTLDSNGQIPTSPQFTLVCTDATGVAPTPVAYRVVEKFGSRATYWIDVPTGSGALDMADIAPLADPPAQPDVYASLDAMQAGDAATLTAAEAYTDAHGGSGAVASVFGRTGTVTAQTGDYTAAQVGADPTGTATTAVAAEATARANADAAEVIARNTAISAAVANLINGAPGALDTLKELADAINDDASFAASVTTALAGKQPLDSDLTAIAALSTTAFGRSFLAMADAAATKTALSLVKGDVGLGNVDNTSDVNKPVSTAQAAALAAWPPIQSTAPDPATTHLWIDTTVDPTDYQPLDTDLTAIAALAPADGQLLQWSNGLGAWTVVNPTGSSLLAYSENNTGTAQASLTSGTTDVTSCSIAVPASTRPVLLFASIAVLASVAPTNAAPTVQITEVSNGTDTPITIDANGGMVTVINRTETLIVPLTQLAVSTARTRTFKLQFVVPGTGTWSVLNGSGYRSVIGAMAG